MFCQCLLFLTIKDTHNHSCRDNDVVLSKKRMVLQLTLMSSWLNSMKVFPWMCSLVLNFIDLLSCSCICSEVSWLYSTVLGCSVFLDGNGRLKHFLRKAFKFNLPLAWWTERPCNLFPTFFAPNDSMPQLIKSFVSKIFPSQNKK